MKARLYLTVLCLLMASAALFASGGSDDEKAKLTFMVNFQAGEVATTLIENLVNEYNDSHDDVFVEFITGSSEYEALMKSKMATNDLPDLWSTHGWSVLRYSEYLMPLEDQEWASRLHPAIKPVITDKAGHIYVLPLDVDMAGIAYNKSVVEKASVDVNKIITWSDLYDAMAAVKASGVTPVHIGGRDNWTVGNFFDWAAPALYITDENNYSGDDLLAGKFDTSKWELLAGLMKEMSDKGYLNKDVLTSTFSDTARALGVGDTAFTFLGNYIIVEALSYNADADLGFIPVPAYYEGDQPSLISGERTTAGIWKDTAYPEQAKDFLAFLARPENASAMATANAIPCGLVDAVSDTGALSDDYAKWGKCSAFPYFDRAFLPNGIWDTMCSTGTGILSGDMTVTEAADKMLEDFKRLYK